MWPFTQSNQIVEERNAMLCMATVACQKVHERLKLIENPLFDTERVIIEQDDVDVFSFELKITDDDILLEDLNKEIDGLLGFLSYDNCGVAKDRISIDLKHKSVRIVMGPGYGIPWYLEQ